MSRLDPHLLRLGRIPREARSFTCDAERARVEFGVDAGLLSDLVEAGLPYEGTGPTRRFEWRDLHYLGLRLALPSGHARAMRAWADSFGQLSSGAAVGARVRYLCSDPRASGEVWALTPAGSIAAIAAPGRPLADFTHIGERSDRELDPAASAVVEDVARTHFYLLPPAYVGDLARARATGLCDCLTAARLVVEGCLERDIEAREAYGLLLSSPLSNPHSWAEIRVDDQWLAVDSLLVGLLRRFGGRVHPPTSPVDAFVVRLGEQPAPLLTAAGEELPALVATSLVSPHPVQPA